MYELESTFPPTLYTKLRLTGKKFRFCSKRILSFSSFVSLLVDLVKRYYLNYTRNGISLNDKSSFLSTHVFTNKTPIDTKRNFLKYSSYFFRFLPDSVTIIEFVGLLILLNLFLNKKFYGTPGFLSDDRVSFFGSLYSSTSM